MCARACTRPLPRTLTLINRPHAHPSHAHPPQAHHPRPTPSASPPAAAGEPPLTRGVLRCSAHSCELALRLRPQRSLPGLEHPAGGLHRLLLLLLRRRLLGKEGRQEAQEQDLPAAAAAAAAAGGGLAGPHHDGRCLLGLLEERWQGGVREGQPTDKILSGGWGSGSGAAFHPSRPHSSPSQGRG